MIYVINNKRGKNLKETLSYVIATPYSVAKSKTGGVISRLLSRLDLELIGAQMITPDEKFVKEFADCIRNAGPKSVNADIDLLANYVEQNMGPSGGRPHRSLLLIFKGENPCQKLSATCGTLFHEEKNFQSFDLEAVHGETIRDTYADLIYAPNDPKKVIYFEPAVLTPRNQSLADKSLKIFLRILKKSENIVQNFSYPDPSQVERTLVIIKPDNWNYASSRPGTIIDMFSRTGLRIVGIKIHRFSMRQALEFYGPVEAALINNIGPAYGHKARIILEREFQITLKEDMETSLVNSFGTEYAREQFRKIIEFMSGLRPDFCAPDEIDKPGKVKCMILVYEGVDAISKIRDVLGPTDPLKAPGGTVRREFGSSIMINTAHASDSRAAYLREKEIVRINENSLESLISENLI